MDNHPSIGDPGAPLLWNPNQPQADTFYWSTDLTRELDAFDIDVAIGEQTRGYAQGSFVQPQATQRVNIPNAFGNPQARDREHSFTPADFHLYQSQESLAPSANSASSGYYVNPRINIDDATQQFRNRNPSVNAPEAVQDAHGNLDKAVFKRTYPVMGALLSDMVVMACILLYFDAAVTTWPDSHALEILATKAVELILHSYAQDSRSIAVEIIPRTLTKTIERWVVSQIRNRHLESVLDVARLSVIGFGLSDGHDQATNLRNFQGATRLSAYLHLFYIPQYLGDPLRIRLAYMNPVLLRVIREAFYASTSSIARRSYDLYLKYPSLARSYQHGQYTWKSSVPLNAWVMGAVAVRQALKEWESGLYQKLTWGSPARGRFNRIRHAISTKSGNRAWFRKLSQYAGTKWHNELRLGHVAVASAAQPSSDTESNYDVPI